MLSDYVQACYGFIAMPIFVIGLLNQFIYQPQLVRLATNLKEGMFTLFRRMIKRQLIIVLGLSVVCMAGAAVLGIPVLSWLYNTDLKDYFGELVILQVAGMFLAISGYLNIVLVTMRKQKSVLVCYLIFMIIAGIAMRPTVRIYGTMGAAIAYVFLLALMCVAFGVLYKIYLNGIIRESGVVNSDEDSGNSVTMLRRKG
jgi:O-antigen/teichoic acid export membrane protein